MFYCSNVVGIMMCFKENLHLHIKDSYRLMIKFRCSFDDDHYSIESS